MITLTCSGVTRGIAGARTPTIANTTIAAPHALESART
jgi:hypothetical protein